MARKKDQINGVVLKNKSSDFNKVTKFKGILFLLPFIIGFVFYFSWIIFQSLNYSFSQIDVDPTKGLDTTFNGLVNYNYAFRVDPDFVKLLTDSISNFLYNIPIILLFSLFIAVILNQKIRGRVFFRAMFFVPVILSTGLIDKIDYSNAVLSYLSSGASIDPGSIREAASSVFSFEFVQDFVSSLNLPISFTDYIFKTISNVVTMINQSGVQILIFLSGLQSISPSIYESAQVEGASGWESFWKITFPMISPMILVNMFYTIIDYFTRTSSPMMTYIENITFTKGFYGEGTAMAWIYFGSIILIMGAVAFVVSRFVFNQQKDH